ncbi:MAG: Adenylate cyclase [uncultured Rubrobacteraceae bacterium]|uniref:Adenylate cyclase n=1 Tax=uncultured Rubrobacteraceae bacterium TaxID=349277 RepID=A0A6J4Q6X7_9ACTN|nr:MAG: Adenylate cyclase [uncultured Rubrobacteraceae bacterium]
MDVQEVEWQFDAGDLEAVEGWLEEYGTGSGFSVAPGSTRELTDTYLDTEDWRLYRAGYALRVRHKGSNKTSEVTMKSLASVGDGDGGKVRRREISERVRNGEGGFPDLSEAHGPAGERLRALAGSHEVRRLFEIRTRRRTFNLRLEAQDDSVESGTDGSSGGIVQDASGNVRRGGDGPRVAEIALDATAIRLDDGEEPARLSRVEVEVQEEEAPDEVSGFVEEMRRSLELEPTTASKYEAGLYTAGLSPDGDPDLGPDDVEASMSVGEVAFAILRKQFAAMREHEPGTRLGEDPEELHDMRVATRRMRAALKLFSGALLKQAGFYRDELKWVAGSLGEVRDLDVQIEHLEALSPEQEEDSGTFGEVVEALKKRRAEARERMLEALDSDRYERFVSSFAGMLRRDPEGEERGEGLANEPITAVAPDLVSRRYKKWRKSGKHLSEESPAEDYHELRKEGKRLRYALEFLTDVYGEKPTMGLVKPLKELQDGLGRHQDWIVAAELLENVATDARRLSPRTAFAMGALSERHLHEAAGMRATLPRSKPYRALIKGKKWEEFEKSMDKRRRSVEKARKKKK